VKDIELADRGGVRVRLGINSDYIPRLPRSSQARLVREGVVGAASIQIVTSSAGQDRTPVAEGEVIRFLPHRSMNEMVDEIRQQMTPAFQELRKAASEMADPGSDFRKSVSAMRELIELLPETTRELRQLLRDTDRTMIAVGKQTESTLGIFARLGTQGEEQLPLLAAKVGTTLDSFSATAAQLHVVLSQAPELMRGSGELVRDSQELAAAARRTWLLRDYIEPSQMHTLPVDSFESFGKR
jgi:ABC-type transporter Mla subunit MlaD